VNWKGSLPLLCLGLTLPGCIFAEPPEQDPRQTPVFFDLVRTVPLVTQLVHFEPQDTSREFTVPVISEDAGEEVNFAVHFNLNLGGNQREYFDPLEPSTLSDTSREIRFSFSPLMRSDTPDACQQLTLVACHRRFFQLGSGQCQDSSDAAMAVWWITFGDTQFATLSDCPQPQPAAP